MANILCILMGIMDFVAGTIILFSFHSHTLAIFFGILMILKGAISFTSLKG